MSGTLEKGSHHQNLDLSEELPAHHAHQHHLQHHQYQYQRQQLQQQHLHQQLQQQQHHQHLHHSNSLASSTATNATAVVGAGMTGGGSETPPPPSSMQRVVVPPPYSAAEGDAANGVGGVGGGGGGGGGGRGGGGGESPPALELRGSLDCWACSVLVTAQNLVIAAVNACLAGVVFGSILTPATAMVVFGFLCHSTVRPHGTSRFCSDLLTDGGCVALLVVGFLLVTPLLVLALAAYCRLARHLQLGLCFIPYSRAVYKNLPATRHHGLGGAGCCGAGPSGGGAGGGKKKKKKSKVWV